MMLKRMSGNADPKALEVLASAVQPPKGYDREGLHEYSTQSALNHMVDAVSPESEMGRKFANLALVISAGTPTPENWQKAREMLVAWRDNDAKLQPALGASDLTAELSGISKSVSQVAGIGLEALDDLQNHRAMNAETKEKNLAVLKAAKKPQAVLLDKLVSPVELLVNAAGK
jgi:hexosaminidase